MSILRSSFLFTFSFFILTLPFADLKPAPETINRVMAIVGKTSISQLDFDRGDEILKALQNQASNRINLLGNHRFLIF